MIASVSERHTASVTPAPATSVDLDPTMAVGWIEPDTSFTTTVVGVDDEGEDEPYFDLDDDDGDDIEDEDDDGFFFEDDEDDMEEDDEDYDDEDEETDEDDVVD